MRRVSPWLILSSVALTLAMADCSFAQDAAAPPAEAPPAEAAATEAPPAEPAAPAADAPIEPPSYNQGDIAWMLISSALVLMMTAPGLFLFYGGLVRKKNVLSVFMQCLILCGVNTVLWVVVGYSLAFSDKGPILFNADGPVGKEVTLIGGLDKVMLEGSLPFMNTADPPVPVFPAAPLYVNVPEMLFMIFQMMFFVITPALICGAFAERMKFSAMLAFTILWGLLIYCPLAHWVWGPKSLFGLGSSIQSLDFAGGLVVHASSGISALVCALFLGKRLGYGKEPFIPHNVTYVAIGASLLWVGWFGFNAGSAISAGTGAVNAFVVTHIAAATALLGWVVSEWLIIGKPTVVGASSGLVAGLVVITPASGFVTAPSALIMGLAAGIVCFLACAKVKTALGYDDALDAFGVHGIGGMLGAILTGVFANEAVGLANAVTIPKNVVLNQAISVGITAALAIVGSVVILSLISVTIGLRVTPEVETDGLDTSEHGEVGYQF